MNDAPTNKERRLARKAERQRERVNKQKKEVSEKDHENNYESITHNAQDSLKKRAADAEDTDENAGHDENTTVHDSEAFEEALSHKERRKRRKMEKQETRAVQTMQRRPQRSPYSVWIGNLTFSTTADDLRTWLADRGIKGVSRVYMTPGARRSDNNKGCVGTLTADAALPMLIYHRKRRCKPVLHFLRSRSAAVDFLSKVAPIFVVGQVWILLPRKWGLVTPVARV